MEPELTPLQPVARAGDAGFSLIELMIVITVLSVLSVAAGFAVGRPEGRGESDAQAFAAAYETLRLQAILERHPHALALTDRGWTPLVPDLAASRGWQVSGSERPLRGVWRTGASGAPLRPAIEDAAAQADLVFLPDGQTTPVDLRFIARAGVTRCSGDGWGGLACRPE